MPVAARVANQSHPLLAALKAGPAGEDTFWERMEVERTPLIEPDPERPGFSLVSYVFPLPEGSKSVVVWPGFGQAADGVMERIPGTNVCHATYRYRDDVRATYGFRLDQPLTAIETASDAEWKAYLAAMSGMELLPDPHHRESFAHRAGGGRPDIGRSILTLPDAPDQAGGRRDIETPHGKLDAHTFWSEVLGNERRIWVCTPPGYASGVGHRMLLVLDGGSALVGKPIHRVLDELVADGRIRPMVAVFVDNPTPAARFEDLHCSEPFARFIETELIPWVRERYAVSHDPADSCATGSSAGGLAALWIGLRLPRLFGVIISQSAALWWGPGYERDKPLRSQRYAPGWLIDEYERAPTLPLRIWQQVGLMETEDRMIEPNRRLKAVLEAKGYDLTYREMAGGHDPTIWRGTIGEALATMVPCASA